MAMQGKQNIKQPWHFISYNNSPAGPAGPSAPGGTEE
jgi:hypothetical protein